MRFSERWHPMGLGNQLKCRRLVALAFETLHLSDRPLREKDVQLVVMCKGIVALHVQKEEVSLFASVQAFGPPP